jgi:hypothetical protein
MVIKDIEKIKVVKKWKRKTQDRNNNNKPNDEQVYKK